MKLFFSSGKKPADESTIFQEKPDEYTLCLGRELSLKIAGAPHPEEGLSSSQLRELIFSHGIWPHHVLLISHLDAAGRVKDSSDSSKNWNTTKKKLNISVDTFSTRLTACSLYNDDVVLDMPFFGHPTNAVRQALDFSWATDQPLKNIQFAVGYGAEHQMFFELDELCRVAEFKSSTKKRIRDVALSHRCDPEELAALLREGFVNDLNQYFSQCLVAEPGRNLHRVDEDLPRQLPENGFAHQNSCLYKLVERGDLFWAGSEKSGDQGLLRNPTFTDQGAQCWADPIWWALQNFFIWDPIPERKKFHKALGVRSQFDPIDSPPI